MDEKLSWRAGLRGTDAGGGGGNVGEDAAIVDGDGEGGGLPSRAVGEALRRDIAVGGGDGVGVLRNVYMI